MIRIATKRSIADYFDDPHSADDIDRISKALWVDSRGQIIDRDTFEQKFNDFLETEPTKKQQQLLGNAVFQQLREDHPSIQNKRLFKKAKGKNLKQDQRTKAKTVYTNYPEYQKAGASKSDLKGLDTPQKKNVFNLVGKSGNRVVYLRKTYVTVNNKRVVRYRDRKGRFGKLEK